MLQKPLTPLLTAIVLLAGMGAAAQDEVPPKPTAEADEVPPELDPDDIIIPGDLPGEDPPAAQEVASDFELEDTVGRCSDQLDNDHDGHADCDDQDCEIFAVCVDAAASQAKPEQAEPAPEPKPVKVPGGYKRAESSRMRVLKVLGHATLWPGIGIAVITTALWFSDDPDTCGEGDSDLFGVCSGWGWGLGGALAVTGAILLSIYYTKRKKIRENDPELALNVSPLVGEGFAGAGGVLVF